jgi:phospholipid/cholesterol/gamma-HCH transport system substrate-binding protein
MAKFRTARAGRQMLGVAFLALLVFFGWLTYAIFNKSFVRTADVTLQTSHVGLQLSKHADVKLRGLLVGEVRDVDVDASGGATIDLALKPESLQAIPKNVSARILPKTLFGEKYVELVVPAQPAGQRLAAGDTIVRDKSSVGIELETVLDDTLPLLRTIKPEQLNATLNAMATALEGRGDDVGENLVLLNDYLKQINPHVPALNDDVSKLADVAGTYNEATPDLMRLLENSTKTGNTVVLKEQALHDFLTDLATTSTSTRTFLEQNETSLISVGEISRPTLNLLETYSPQYKCLLEGMANYIPRFEDAFGEGEHFDGSAPALHITLELVPQRQSYDANDKPEFIDDSGPGCHTLPNPPYSQKNPAPASDVEVGVDDDDAAASGIFNPTSGFAGTQEEQELIDAIAGPAMGTSPEDVPDLATLLFGPMARGSEVNLR